MAILRFHMLNMKVYFFQRSKISTTCRHVVPV